ncbi:MAG: type II secretion system protein N [Myxococcota bacterium]
MGSWLIMGLNGLLLAASCFVVAHIVTQVGGAALEPPPADTKTTRLERPGDASAATPSTILARNLFGAQLEGEAQVQDVEPSDEPLTATKLPLKLLGTIAGTMEDRSRAAIQNEKTRQHIVVAVGDRFEDFKRVSVTAIERSRVILNNAGKPEELALHDDLPARPKAKKKRPARQARRARPSPDTLNDRLKSLQGQDGKGISDILSSARIVPAYDNGEMLGMKVDAIKADSLFEKVGLEDGDIITEVNGIVVDRVEATSAIFDELSTADALNIVTSRGGSTLKLSANADDLIRE